VTWDVAIVGSGFAGSILARVLRRQGLEVLVLEQGRHPRFALGESSTPLAAASLERLARRFGLADLDSLAAYGRWIEDLPHLRRGRKRGFTFYNHPGDGTAYRATVDTRMLVAASPADAVADAHWLRQDVDHHLVLRARDEGVVVAEESTVTSVERRDGRVRLAGSGPSGRFEEEARLVVDASGPAAVVARALGAGSGSTSLPPRGLAFAHLGEMPDFHEMVDGPLPPGPYPDEWAAVHHLMTGGWFYRLRFDHDVSSCGLLLTRAAWSEGPDPAADPRAAVEWQLAVRAPTLARQVAGVPEVISWRWVPEVAHRLDRAAGEGWLALPHAFAFVDPLFSTGIAWSLRAIERLVDVVDGTRSREEHARLLAAEADRIETLVGLAWTALPHPAAFQAVAFLYFAAVSFQEARERLLDPDAPSELAWDGFLGVGDPGIDAWFDEAPARLAADPGSFPAWVASAIEPRNVAGLADPAKGGLYGVDLEDLVRGAAKLGLSAAQVRHRIGRLRGAAGRANPENR